MNRRKPSTVGLKFAAILLLAFLDSCSVVRADERPNILWISCEDISPHLGCYGDEYARTPNLDALAREGVRFDRAFTHAGVCAVLRSGVITGVYPISIGSQHMRSQIVPPPHIKCFPEYLRAAGYYCTNRSKTDYQFNSPSTAWDQPDARHDDWRGRAEGQPFFSVINLTISHESQIRHGVKRHAEVIKQLQPAQIHDPQQAGKYLPPYLPETPASRQDWSFYSDNISEMDRQAGEILQRLQEDGLVDNTLVVFWSDHGQGMPRGKRWLYDSGTHVPLIMRWPNKLQPGTVREDLVTMLDLPPTMLSLAGVTPPDYMHGRVIIGQPAQPEPKYIFFHRDRMDETYDLIRAARDRRFKYVRNFEPDRPYAQHIDYMDEMPTMQDWRRLNAADELNADQKKWFAPKKPLEELYDTLADPYELNNLADDPKLRNTLREMREALAQWQIDVGDLGMIPETILMQRMRPAGKIEQTAEPEIVFEDNDGGILVSIRGKTPGASIDFAVGDGKKAGDKFKLYAQPFLLESGQSVTAKCCRLGFKDSKTVTKKVARSNSS